MKVNKKQLPDEILQFIQTMGPKSINFVATQFGWSRGKTLKLVLSHPNLVIEPYNGMGRSRKIRLKEK